MQIHIRRVKMVLNISESGVLLESPAKHTAGLPQQAFAISLSGSVIEDMIACVQNGGDIQLALGSSPVSIEAPASVIAGYCLLFSAIVYYSVVLHNSPGVDIAQPASKAPQYQPNPSSGPSHLLTL